MRISQFLREFIVRVLGLPVKPCHGLFSVAKNLNFVVARDVVKRLNHRLAADITFTGFRQNGYGLDRADCAKLLHGLERIMVAMFAVDQNG